MKSIGTKGVSATLSDYVFSKKCDFIEGCDVSTQSVKLIHVFLGLLIHVGYCTY
ncbi:hypothetical protein K503DRAFT_602893 [Rhizopogon vinicolor AM-OR11-026]|uniref:Uncharacterized protein n=1 Tax=Rhizopogon vinicolor AM-OR11-026 TaxID=1314800 RepID=A0A1B7N6S4_9AGAM|nr:hypothetical protein K503DRAFT_602893 [Rhizopogon vinicolor AM-OR11-026]